MDRLQEEQSIEDVCKEDGPTPTLTATTPTTTTLTTGNGLRQVEVVAEVVTGALVGREEGNGDGPVLTTEDGLPPEGAREEALKDKEVCWHRLCASVYSQ